MKVSFIGAAHEVTGSCHMITVGDKHYLVDCGMEQGPDLYENQRLPVSASDIEAVFLTHAHIDHSGLLPLLYKEGFRGQIFATNATTQLCVIMLKDSAHIQEQEAEWKNRKAMRAGSAKVEPIYSVEDAENALTLFVPCDYDQDVEVNEMITLCFRDAGHLLGSSFIEIKVKEDGEETKLVFSGDLGNGNRVLIRDPEVPKDADYLFIESTYGDRLHDTPPDYAVELAKILQMTFQRGGNVVIPAFAVGRTQEMLYYMREIKQRQLLPDFAGFKVYVDSPMAVEATNIFNRNVLECFRQKDVELIRQGVNPIRFQGLEVSVTSDDSKAINFVEEPIVIISASGMCEAGRIRHHLKYNLWRPESSVVFVGYQVPGTLGNQLLNGVSEVKLFGEKINVAAQIINLPGISGHADRDHLTAWVEGMEKKPKRIFVVHGEDVVTDNFAVHLTETTGVPAIAPYSGDVFDLTTNTQIAIGDRKRKAKKSIVSTAKLLPVLAEAAQRLAALVRSCAGMANKDQKKLANQINEICDRWEKK
ncbi:MAG: MBL fold metallo-hydrolase [Lachnospiraceae bacterium]|nr:MBL fold metallo-hydrolase [Lachnospiraceae bacterium]